MMIFFSIIYTFANVKVHLLKMGIRCYRTIKSGAIPVAVSLLLLLAGFAEHHYSTCLDGKATKLR
jgi:hypothetical protein